MSTITPHDSQHGRLWTDAHWLGHCEGCAVNHIDGDRLGVVESVVRQTRTSEPSELVVRLSSDPTALLVVPLADVVEVHSAADRIIVKSRPLTGGPTRPERASPHLGAASVRCSGDDSVPASRAELTVLIRVEKPADAASLCDFLSRQGWPCHQTGADAIAVLPTPHVSQAELRLRACIRNWRAVQVRAGAVTLGP